MLVKVRIWFVFKIVVNVTYLMLKLFLVYEHLFLLDPNGSCNPCCYKTYYYCCINIILYLHNFNKTCKILHYWYHNICMLIVTYFIVVSFKEMLVYSPRRWQDNWPENVGAI